MLIVFWFIFWGCLFIASIGMALIFKIWKVDKTEIVNIKDVDSHNDHFKFKRHLKWNKNNKRYELKTSISTDQLRRMFPK